MKKLNKYFGLLVIIFGIFIMLPTNTKAATSLPADYETNGFKYTIEGFNIKIYDEDGFLKNRVYKTIKVPNDKVTINPVGSEVNTPEGMPKMTGVKLNFSLEGTSVEQLVKKEIPTITGEDEFYGIFLEVDYKINQIPQGYTYMNRLNFLNIFAGIMGSLTSDDSFNIEDTKISLSTTTSQIIDIAAYGMNEGKVVYATQGEDGSSGKEAAVEDYVILSNTNELDFTDSEFANSTYGFMIHDLDNLEEVLSKNANNYDGDIIHVDDDGEENSTTVTKQVQKVAVPNTARNGLKISIVLGGIIMIIGTVVVVRTLEKDRKVVDIEIK